MQKDIFLPLCLGSNWVVFLHIPMPNETKRRRYSRNIALTEIGEQGQEALNDTKVLIVGAGGLGSPVILYLAAAGIGNIGIVDKDRVDISNLQRQIIYNEEDIGRPKAQIAAQRASALNPYIKPTFYPDNLNKSNASSIIKNYDIVADCSDNFQTRFIVNEYCYQLQKPLISGAVTGFSGHIATFKSYLGGQYPCYRCFCPQLPPEDLLPNCLSGGVLGSVTGVIGSLQATEIIKEALGKGKDLSQNIIIYEGLTTNFRKISLKKDPACELCVEV